MVSEECVEGEVVRVSAETKSAVNERFGRTPQSSSSFKKNVAL